VFGRGISRGWGWKIPDECDDVYCIRRRTVNDVQGGE
jgi:hypothetical protein